MLPSCRRSSFSVCKVLSLKSSAQFSGHTYYQMFSLRFPCLQEIHHLSCSKQKIRNRPHCSSYRKGRGVKYHSQFRASYVNYGSKMR